MCLALNTTLAQDNARLEEKKGYKNIKLGAEITTISEYDWPIAKPKSEGDRVKWLRYAHLPARRIGNVKLRMVVVKSFDEKIMEIVLRFKTQDYSEMLSNLSSAYGKPEENTWESESVILTINDNRAVITYKPLYSMYQEYKAKINIKDL